ncbi:MAG: hypothetical protein H6945_13830 [Zoogloeaceae bacterium]|nr:hypothetical protein [Rhodocyclaceae bacterium]MCP5236808.1 hypothetical protein [Zoogloeaceae bacterium]
MEELVEGAVRACLRLASLTVRVLIWLIWDLWFEIVAWYVGWPVARLLTLGRLPRESIGEHHAAGSLTVVLVGALGLVCLLALASVLTRLVQTAAG